MKIQVLGPGCRNCQNLAANTEKEASQLGLEYDLEKVTSPNDIAKFGIIRTPALAIDGKVKIMGRVADVAEITTILTTFLMQEYS